MTKFWHILVRNFFAMTTAAGDGGMTNPVALTALLSTVVMVVMKR